MFCAKILYVLYKCLLWHPTSSAYSRLQEWSDLAELLAALWEGGGIFSFIIHYTHLLLGAASVLLNLFDKTDVSIILYDSQNPLIFIFCC